MINYPSLGQDVSSSRTLLDDIVTDRAANGLLRQRIFYSGIKNEFSVVHVVDSNNKNLLINHYSGTVTCTGAITSTNTLTVSAVTSGYLTPGVTISGGTITAGTTIVSQLTITGGVPYRTGTYLTTVSANQTSTTITGSSQGRLSSFSFTWNAESTTHTCRYAIAPTIQILGGTFFNVTNKLVEV